MPEARIQARSDRGSRHPTRTHVEPPGGSLLEVRIDRRHAEHSVSEILRREGAESHLIDCRLTDQTPRRLLRWLDIDVEPERMDHLLHALRRLLPLPHRALARLGPRRVLVRVSEPAPAACTATYRAGGLCVSCPLQAREEGAPWRVILPRGARTRAFLRDLPRASTTPPAIVRLRPYRSKTTLTLRQDRALRIAYDLGYFAYPRRGSLGDVARMLGTSRSTTLELLRRATAKLAGLRYGDDLHFRRPL